MISFVSITMATVSWSRRGHWGLALAGLLLGCDPEPSTGTMLILAPGEPTTFTLDDGEPQEVKSVLSLELPPGKHQVVFSKPAQRSADVEVEANRSVVVPAIDGQCYVALNVSSSHYANEQGQRLGSPAFEYLEQQSTPFSPPGDHYFSEASLPKQRSSSGLTGLYVSGTCDALKTMELDQRAAGK